MVSKCCGLCVEHKIRLGVLLVLILLLIFYISFMYDKGVSMIRTPYNSDNVFVGRGFDVPCWAYGRLVWFRRAGAAFRGEVRLRRGGGGLAAIRWWRSGADQVAWVINVINALGRVSQLSWPSTIQARAGYIL